jgi:hypothetical protein
MDQRVGSRIGDFGATRSPICRERQSSSEVAAGSRPVEQAAMRGKTATVQFFWEQVLRKLRN